MTYMHTLFFIQPTPIIKIKYLKLKDTEYSMNAGAKLIIGLIILIAGIYWYASPSVMKIIGIESTRAALATVFTGLFGLFLVFIGLIITWIEYEDIKWSRREKKEAATVKDITTATK